MKKIVVMITILSFVLIIGMPGQGEAGGSKSCIPNLEGTWTGKMDKVTMLGFIIDEDVTFEIIEQEDHLFIGVINQTFFTVDPPIFGAIVGCREIRISTGQTVLFATVDRLGEVMDGYYFSTDPLVPDGIGGWVVKENPHMGTFTLRKIDN